MSFKDLRGLHRPSGKKKVSWFELKLKLTPTWKSPKFPIAHCVPVARHYCSKIQKVSSVPLLANLFGNTRRIALAMGQEDIDGLRDVGKLPGVFEGAFATQRVERPPGELAQL